jgi:hypothetical protein
MRSSAVVLFAQLGTVFSFTADFESDFGDLYNPVSTNSWLRLSGSTTSSFTGPSFDHTTGSGYYAYIESSTPNYPNVGPFILEASTSAGVGMVSFYYHMYDGDTSSDDMGDLYFQTSTDGGTTYTDVWSKSGNQGDSWQEAMFYLSDSSINMIRFSATTGTLFQSDIAIDDVEVTSAGYCVSGDNVVKVMKPESETAVEMTLAQVQVGDRILAKSTKGSEAYAPVVDLPRSETNQAFIEITTTASNVVRATPFHTFPTCKDGVDVRAKDVREGGCLLTVNGKEHVSKINRIEPKDVTGDAKLTYSLGMGKEIDSISVGGVFTHAQRQGHKVNMGQMKSEKTQNLRVAE